MNYYPQSAFEREVHETGSFTPLATSRPRSKAHVRFCLALALAHLDVLALAVGFVIATIVGFGSVLPDSAASILGVMLVLYSVCALLARAYTGSALIELGQTIRRSTIAFAAAFGLLLLILFLLKANAEVSRARLIVTLVSSGLALAVARYSFIRFASRALSGRLYSTVVLRDGMVDIPEAKLRAESYVDVSNILDLYAPDAEGFDELATIIGHADRVVVFCDQDRRALWADVLKGMNVHAEVIARELLLTAPLGLGKFVGDPTLVLTRGPLSFPNRVSKRAFDLVVAVSALVFLSPLLIATAVAIRVDSPGSIFFRQPRIGRQNKIFWVLKFRSMHSDKCDVSASTLTAVGDSRITRIGHFIRRTSIDELPQLLNVLRGDMSIVGPRPHAIQAKAADLLYWDADPRYWHRHACKPGITGLAQVRGHRGSTDLQQDLINRVDSDLDYLSNWSLWQDVLIVMRTIKVLSHPNAY